MALMKAFGKKGSPSAGGSKGSSPRKLLPSVSESSMYSSGSDLPSVLRLGGRFSLRKTVMQIRAAMRLRTQRPSETMNAYHKYRTGPLPQESFRKSSVEKIVTSAVNKHLQNYKYDVKTASRAAKEVSDVIRNELKQLNMARYKLIVYTLISEKQGQAGTHVSRFVWDTDTDNHVSVLVENKTCTAVVNVYAVYYE